MMDRQTNLKWGLISFLAVLGLVRPLLSITDTYEVLGGSSWATVIVTVLIAILWVGVVVIKRDPNPLVTLLATGGLYGVLAILLQQIIWNFFLGKPPEEAPSSAPVLVMSWASIVVTNVIWGTFLGLVALGLRRLLPQRGAEA